MIYVSLNDSSWVCEQCVFLVHIYWMPSKEFISDFNILSTLRQKQIE